VEKQEVKRGAIQSQGCMLIIIGMLLACIVLVLAPTGYAFYRYRTAQVYSGDLSATGKPITLPIQRADSYTITLQPQSSAQSGVTLGFLIQDSFGRTLVASTDFYTTGCSPDSPANQTCPAQSRDFAFHDSLGGPVLLTLSSTQPNLEVAIQIRDQDQGGIFANGSLIVFGAFLGCGSLLWVVVVALLTVLARRLERSQPHQQPAETNQQAPSRRSQNDTAEPPPEEPEPAPPETS
jgi:hypothetical protein